MSNNRPVSEVSAAIKELADKVWYGRHCAREESVATGKIRIVERGEVPQGMFIPDQIVRDVWEAAQLAAEGLEDKYGAENLGPWDEFEWGMLNGKLSALRWVLGDQWDMMST